MRVMRTWKRDGSTNLMGLTAAIDNLKQNGKPEWVRRKSLKGIIDGLCRGEVFETRLAFFKLYNGNGDHYGHERNRLL